MNMKCLHTFRFLQFQSRLTKQSWSFRYLHRSSIFLMDKKVSENKTTFDPRLLDILACPLSKKPLRYDQANNELVCDDIGVAYSIEDGIPNLNPIHGRMLHKRTAESKGNCDR